ncbi:Gfo/Idh/MocA family protein [Aidingimonas lacisalsi]|uniref:Gfo/Idh/MocA family protein n=1 Tax=Aidingimonas lacisalsi TaxID=2604086 RepID=UPI0011D251FA|nr:Gfo/Idh/MocA family oxidoreductase [Aidingimonas lacisalsi]
MVTRVGMLGVSEGNGHPFSFATIINGYRGHGLKEAGWPGIDDYVRRRHDSEFGVGDMRVTHAWTQESEQTSVLCEATGIPNAMKSVRDMIGEVDAVIIARDDPESHRELAIPFLEAGIPVFIDKPLTLDPDDLRDFLPYLQQGKLMSCSGMRYAKELDAIRDGQVEHGDLKVVRGTIVKDWARYGIHLLDAILPLLPARPLAVTPLPGRHESVLVTLADGLSLTLDALGDAPATFRIELMGSRAISRVDIADNFSMFRRTLWEFQRMIVDRRPPIPVTTTLDSVLTLIAGQRALSTRKEVALDDFDLS